MVAPSGIPMFKTPEGPVFVGVSLPLQADSVAIARPAASKAEMVRLARMDPHFNSSGSTRGSDRQMGMKNLRQDAGAFLPGTCAVQLRVESRTMRVVASTTGASESEVPSKCPI